MNTLRGLTLALRLMAYIALNKVNLLCLSLCGPLNQKHNGYTKKWFCGWEGGKEMLSGTLSSSVCIIMLS